MKFKRFTLTTAAALLAGCAQFSDQTNQFTEDPNTEPKEASASTTTSNTAVIDHLSLSKDITGGDLTEDDYKNATAGFIARPKEDLIICPGNKDVDYTDESDPCGDDIAPIWSLKDYMALLAENGGDADHDNYIDSGDFTFNPLPGEGADPNEESEMTVNPSLWRNAKLNVYYGLYQVHNVNSKSKTPELGDIYQVRGYDLSNITFVKGEEGWIVFDPLISPETAKASYDLVTKHLGNYDVTSIIYSHSHSDHYGGITGLESVLSEEFEIYAPEGFTEHAVSENVIAGNAMGRRAVYMYGSLLDRNRKGSVNAGLGMTTSTGVPGLLLPTTLISEETESTTCTELKTGRCPYSVDGVNMVFQMTPGTEAPAEMNTWLPDQKALWMAENTTNTMHNILTLRGAKVRDALLWAKYLNETIELYGDEAKVKFQSHHWPVWGQPNIKEYLEKQRDVYKYMHDQTVRMMNKGYNGEEISEMMELPGTLEQNWATRGYYGTLRHNTRAIYQYYMGWYDGHPSDLNNLPDVQASIRYVDFMGGADKAYEKAKKAFDRGEYRWVAEVLKHVVFAYKSVQFNLGNGDYSYCESCDDPNGPLPENVDKHAKALLADTLEQLGYQAESGPWRSVYLQGAQELRAIIDKGNIEKPNALQLATPDVIEQMSVDMLLDYLAIRLDVNKANNTEIFFNIVVPDTPNNSTSCNTHAQSAPQDRDQPKCGYSITLKNSVLNYSFDMTKPNSADVYLAKKTLSDLLVGNITIDDIKWVNSSEEVGDSENQIYAENQGEFETFIEQFEILTEPAAQTDYFWFDIITPNEPVDMIIN
ncbi:alkyl sulfatase dimerization domain-containing protein [Parendozoicomonas sp. Alg238-R29]|uniref:alkyl/aryl-sulfatase n=1 Tax=Parendozoicomonas sp. Alg238-R29 TaxID=2993446 RepID=UPI00248EA89B|nr:alkyl sulfatase dimerization domain-containing protein [Parendozoicomonas sp. Alg238-R29]